MRLRSILTLMLACVAMLLPMSRAMAQAELPQDTITRSPLNEADKQLVDKFVAARLPDLSSSDPMAMKKSREELLRPFRNTGVSVPFRQYYSEKLKDELKKNVGGKDAVVISALIIAGDVATNDTAAIVESKLNDPGEAIRYAAVKGVERIVDAVSTRNPALPASSVERLIGKLGDVVKDPTSTEKVIDGAIRALRKSMELSRPGFEERLLAMRTLCESAGALSDRVDAPPKELVRASELILELFTKVDPAHPMTPEGSIQCAAMSGQLLSWVSCQVKKGRLPVGDTAAREDALKIVKAAERTIRLAGEKLSKPNAATALADEFAKATTEGDRNFYRTLLTLLDPLNAAPFNIKPETFLKCNEK